MAVIDMPFNRLRAAVLALGITLGGLAVTATPAMANDGTCGSGDLCLSEHTSHGGGQWDVFGAVMNYDSGERWWGTTQSINDQASSARNKRSTAYGICENSWGRGSCVYIGGNFEIKNLSDYEMNDKASSNIW
ncbi:hypothetical protein KBX06_03200 [Micromonospora sp. C31]|uniref:hypothetical protein n=1 Tax=Micromonospora sp. C31 TaxID=2824876 RepID=UPI001B377F67|nr:hypothetical protein [Micromonospora sp. C31]MBQ1072176.1 hypothetical protein [Micromonospora sp. C31]